MTNLEFFLHYVITVSPAIAVLGFLLLRRRQSIRAELDELTLRQLHGQRMREAEAKRTQAISALGQAYAPAALMAVQRLFDARQARPVIHVVDGPDDFDDDHMVHLEDLLRARDRRCAPCDGPPPRPEPDETN